MSKIAFVNQRYGLEVNGGSEYYTRLMAEHLSGKHEVEVLTSKALSYEHWADHYPNDVEEIHGVTVRRFSVAHNRRKLLMKFLSNFIKRLHFNWNWLCDIWVRQQGPYVPGLVQYISEHKNEYDAIFFVTYLYYPTVVGIEAAPEKAILIPTAHDEPYIYFKSHARQFQIAKGIIYLTEEEKELVNRLFHNESVPSIVAGVGIDVPEQPDPGRFRGKYHITDPYILYTGRIDKSKGCDELFRYFQEYKKQQGNHVQQASHAQQTSHSQQTSYPQQVSHSQQTSHSQQVSHSQQTSHSQQANSLLKEQQSQQRAQENSLQLVLMGQQFMDIPKHPDIHYLGFVSEQDKMDGVAGADVLCLPSAFESLSISVLEAMSCGVPVLVNGKCEVLKGHCEKSGGGLAYSDSQSFCKYLKQMTEDTQVHEEMSQKARTYVEENYRWDRIIEKVEGLLYNIAH